MAILLELEPAVEETLSRLAAKEGMAAGEYVSRVVAAEVARRALTATEPEREGLGGEELGRVLDRLASHGAGNVPRGETYPREMIYADERTSA
jgi:hypothetical protein